MSDFWRAKVDVANLIRTPANLTPDPTPDNTGAATAFPNGANGPQYLFRVIDFFPIDPFGVFTFYVTIEITCSARSSTSPTPGPLEWHVTERHIYDDFEFNPTFENVFGTFDGALGSNGADFLNNVTLRIERDDTAGTYTAFGLMGTSSFSFAAGDNAKQMCGYQIGALTGPYVYGGSLVGPVPANIVRTHFVADFSSFYTYKNDLVHPYRGASLAVAARGHWVNGTSPYEPWRVYNIGTNDFSIPAIETSTALEANIDSGIDSSTHDAGGDVGREDLTWDLNFFFPVAGTKIDLTHSWEHGAHWRAYAIASAPAVLNWQRSHDKGHSWTGDVIDAGGGDVDSPSINWTFGKLVAVWYRGAAIVQSISSDLGQTWGTPVALSISGSNPRHLVDPHNGFSWYFFFDDNKLKLLRSGNLGTQFVEATPIVAIDPMDQQTVAAQLALDGSLLVTYFSAGAVAQIRSTDLGRTWSAA